MVTFCGWDNVFNTTLGHSLGAQINNIKVSISISVKHDMLACLVALATAKARAC